MLEHLISEMLVRDAALNSHLGCLCSEFIAWSRLHRQMAAAFMDRHRIITTCTNRKRVAVSAALRARTLSNGTESVVAGEWIERVGEAKSTQLTHSVVDVYGGRSFQEALRASPCRSRIVVVSAGLGLLRGDDEIPGYSLTVSPGSPDSVVSKVTDWNLTNWWRYVRQGPFSRISFEEVFESDRDEVVVFALSAPYLSLIVCDLLALPVEWLARARLVGLKQSRVPPELSHLVMPYDDRLEDPTGGYQGTRADFPQRAARHFVETVLSTGARTAFEDQGRVQRHLARWSPRVSRERRRLDDDELKAAIWKAWPSTGGRSGQTLRFLRDELGVACEQGRFKKLFAQVRETILEEPA